MNFQSRLNNIKKQSMDWFLVVEGYFIFDNDRELKINEDGDSDGSNISVVRDGRERRYRKSGNVCSEVGEAISSSLSLQTFLIKRYLLAVNIISLN